MEKGTNQVFALDRPRALKELAHSINTWRHSEAAQEFHSLRKGTLDFKTALKLEIIVPICEDCHIEEQYGWGLEPEMPHIMPDAWQLDLLLLGFHLELIKSMEAAFQEDPDADIHCHLCNRQLRYWADDNCYADRISFEDYFGLQGDERKRPSKQLRQQLKKLFDSRCFGCGRYLSVEEITLDHIIARKHGGQTSVTNLQVLCPTCNNKKKDLSIPVKEICLTFPFRPPPSDAYEGVTW